MTGLTARAVLAALGVCACLVLAGGVWAAETLTAHASFHPDELGASTNLTVTTTLHSPAGEVPSPVRQITTYLPAGVQFRVQGTGTCTATQLERSGPSACPADSRVGFGGGEGLIQLAKGIVREPFTIDLFLGPRQHRQLQVLAFVEAKSPTFFEVVAVGHEIHAAKPYGVGLSLTIPPIATLPEAPDASMESAFMTVGDSGAAFYREVGGKQKLVHVKGLVLPTTCPAGGFRSKAILDLADGSSLTTTPTVPCPRS